MQGPDDDAPQIGRRFGDFVAVERLGAGGMAEVYLGARAKDGDVELAAVKRLLPHLAWELEFLRMFLAEAELASQLQHPNIARVSDFGTAEGGHYLVMEYVHGATLRTVLETLDTQRVTLELGVGLVAELASALHYAHEWVSPDGSVTGIVHRDISPSNVMLTCDGRVKLLDFGIARMHGRTQQTRAGTIKGKLGYMSPEQCRGEPVDRRSDVFGMGVLLYELCTQQRAFFADNEYGFIGRILAGDYVAPHEVEPGFPPELAAIIDRCLAVEPDARYADAAALRLALEGFAAHQELDTSAERRAAILGRLVGAVPVPTVDRKTIKRLASKHDRRRRWWPLVPMSLAVGAVGVVIGVVAASPAASKVPTPVPPAAADPAVTAPVVPSTRGDARAEGAAAVRVESGESRTAEHDDAGDDQSQAPEAGPPAPTGRHNKRRRAEKRRRKANAKVSEQVSIDAKALLPPSWRD